MRVEFVAVIAVLALAGCGAAAAPAAPTAVAPTAQPTAPPTAAPTAVPTAVPTAAPTAVPTAVPTAAPTLVPTDLIGARLDVAEAELDPLGISYVEIGGGTFGIIVESNWFVCQTKPAAGKPIIGSLQLIVNHYNC